MHLFRLIVRLLYILLLCHLSTFGYCLLPKDKTSLQSSNKISSPKFILSSLVTSNGSIYAGTEGEGLFIKDCHDSIWRKDSTFEHVGGTNVFALCEDIYGRIWAGTLDCGVCVLDESGWSRLSIPEGMPGSHIYALCPTRNGNVWIATDAGLCRYSEESKNLFVHNRYTGLCTEEISAIAETPSGAILAGSACHGLFRTDKSSQWTNWLKLKTTSQRINSISTRKDGSILLTSNEAIEWSTNEGNAWHILAKRNPGCAKPVTSTFYDKCAIIGYEENSLRHITPNSRKSALPFTIPKGAVRITSLSFRKDILAIGTYGNGVLIVDKRKRQKMIKRKRIRRFHGIKHTILASSKQSIVQNKNCFYMKDDWETKGNWCGRYGLRTAVLCAQHAPYGSDIICSDPRYKVSAAIGDNKTENDVLRHWVHWSFTTNPNVLHNPHIGHRRQSEWDDHSEAYPQSNPGPNLLITVDIPGGWHENALYFFNKDGAHGNNFRRDYTIKVFDGSKSGGVPLAKSRIRRFRNGIYKRFAIKGPGKYTFLIERDNSFSTILSGVFIQQMSESPETQKTPRISTCAHYGGIVYREPIIEPNPKNLFRHFSKICRNEQEYDFGIFEATSCYRNLINSLQKNTDLIKWLDWNLRVWTDCERTRFNNAMLASWTCLQIKSPSYRCSKYHPHSPNVIDKELSTGDFSQKYPLSWINAHDVKNPEHIMKSDSLFYWKIANLKGRTDYLNE